MATQAWVHPLPPPPIKLSTRGYPGPGAPPAHLSPSTPRFCSPWLFLRNLLELTEQRRTCLLSRLNCKAWTFVSKNEETTYFHQISCTALDQTAQRNASLSVITLDLTVGWINHAILIMLKQMSWGLSTILVMLQRICVMQMRYAWKHESLLRNVINLVLLGVKATEVLHSYWLFICLLCLQNLRRNQCKLR